MIINTYISVWLNSPWIPTICFHLQHFQQFYQIMLIPISHMHGCLTKTNDNISGCLMIHESWKETFGQYSCSNNWNLYMIIIIFAKVPDHKNKNIMLDIHHYHGFGAYWNNSAFCPKEHLHLDFIMIWRHFIGINWERN